MPVCSYRKESQKGWSGVFRQEFRLLNESGVDTLEKKVGWPVAFVPSMEGYRGCSVEAAGMTTTVGMRVQRT